MEEAKKIKEEAITNQDKKKLKKTQ